MSKMYDKLENLYKSDMVPLHMPGHKRNENSGDMSDYFKLDITEIDEFDNLHDEKGIILEAEKRANNIYGAEETHFLVNGSTSGILSAVSASTEKGGEIIAARNCHKSFYHAAFLRDLDIHFLSPGKIKADPSADATILYGEIDPKEVEVNCKRYPEASSIIITTPTYEGIPSNVAEIARIAHSYGKILIADEAHGAHFGLYKDFPQNAIEQGADIVIHSVHKTLPSMTQTALIHVQGDLVNREKLRRFLHIYQSSSPSYVLMTSIDSCINEIREKGNKIFSRVCRYNQKIRRETKQCKHLFIPDISVIPDPCKILICCKDCSINGQQIYDILRLEHHIQLEMAGDFYGLAIITGYDSEENIDRLIFAINSLDKDLEEGKSHTGNSSENASSFNRKIIYPDNNPESCETISKENETREYPEKVIPFYKAFDSESETIDISSAMGKIAGDFINLYPPGIPIILPGERFSKEIIEKISNYINTGRNVQGVEISENFERKVKIIRGR
ncbi:MAG: amino acid decarboxylase [Lachnospiraceae bacterium]|nr:amino acid decarboxylase [Lachnospiraceae bacterium]